MRRILLAVVACIALAVGILTATVLRAGPDRRPAVAAGSATATPGSISPGRTGSASPAPGTAASGPGSSATTIIVGASKRGARLIGSQYIGLSFESNSDTGGVNSGRFDTVGNLARLMRNLGTGVIRFGGNSVDRNYRGATAVALAGLARLARATGWSVLYSEDLAQYDAAAVRRDVSHVRAALGTHLAGLDCGNEPDLYRRNGHRPRSYTESQYIAQDAACLREAAAAAPGVPLAGPDAVGTAWLRAYGAQRDIRVQWVNRHYYPIGCTIQADMTDAQLVRYLLSPGQAARESAMFTATRDAAAAQAARPRISETDSAGCDTAPGIAGTYAAALWAIDYLLTGAEDGMDGVNFHTGLNIRCASYSPLCGTHIRYEYAPRAEYYGLLFTHLLGSGRLLPVRVKSGSNVTAFALSPFSGGGPRLMVENLSATPTRATLRIGGDPRSATVLRLSAPSPLATSGITIQGAQVAADGSFTPGAPSSVGCAAGTCHVTIAPYTAVIVAVG